MTHWSGAFEIARSNTPTTCASPAAMSASMSGVRGTSKAS